MPFHYARRYSVWGAYALVVASGIVGFHSIRHIDRQQSRDLCALVQNDRQATRLFLDALTRPIPITAAAAPDTRQRLVQANEVNARLRALADAYFHPPDCSEVVQGKPIPLPTIPPTSAP